MCNGSVDRDEKVDHRNDGSGIGKIGEVLAELDNAIVAENRSLDLGHFFLHTDEVETLYAEHACQSLKLHRAISIIRVYTVAGPTQSYARTHAVRQPRPPHIDALLKGPQIRNVRRNRREFSAKR